MESLHSPFTPDEAGSATTAEQLLTGWLRKCASTQAVQVLTPTTQAQLLAVMQHILADTGDVNLDPQDVWEVLAGAATLQFGMATGSGVDRAKVIGPQLWNGTTVLGRPALPATRLLLAVYSGPLAAVEMDELTDILEYITAQAGDQAEIVFGHGYNAALGDSIQLLLPVSRH